MARGGEADLHCQYDDGQMSDFLEISPRSNIVNIICCGVILSEGYKLRNLLLHNGVEAGLFSVTVVMPINEKMVSDISKHSKIIVTMEDHNIIGGLGGAVAEVISSTVEKHAVLLRIGLDETFTEIVGD